MIPSEKFDPDIHPNQTYKMMTIARETPITRIDHATAFM